MYCIIQYSMYAYCIVWYSYLMIMNAYAYVCARACLSSVCVYVLWRNGYMRICMCAREFACVYMRWKYIMTWWVCMSCACICVRHLPWLMYVCVFLWPSMRVCIYADPYDDVCMYAGMHIHMTKYACMRLCVFIWRVCVYVKSSKMAHFGFLSVIKKIISLYVYMCIHMMVFNRHLTTHTRTYIHTYVHTRWWELHPAWGFQVIL